MKETALFRLIWGLSGCLLLLYVVFLPIWEGFDETPNFCYVQFLVEQKKIPKTPTNGETDYCSREVETTLERLPLNQSLVHIGTLERYHYPQYQAFWSQHSDALVAPIPNTAQLRTTTTQRLDIWQGQHPPIPYAVLGLAYIVGYSQDFYVRFLLVRLFGVLIVWLGAALVWKALQLTIKESGARLIGFAALVLHPMFFVHFGRVTNESVTFFLFAACWLMMMRIIQQPRISWKWAMAFGLTYGAGILSKVFFLSALPAVIVLFALDFWQKRAAIDWKNAFWSYLIIAACIALPAAPWYYYQHVGFVTPGVGFSLQESLTFPLLIHKILYMPWLAYGVEIVKNFIGFFGWSFLHPGHWYYIVHSLFFIAVLFGLVTLRKTEVRIMVYASLFPLCMLLGMSYYNLRFNYLSITGGWYFFSLTPMLALLVSLAAQRLVQSKYQLLVLYGIMIFHGVSMLAIMMFTLAPVYYAI